MSQAKPDNNSLNFATSKEKENIVAAIALRIRQSLDLNVILHQAVVEVREFLQTDRVLLYRFEPDWSGVIVTESVKNDHTVVGYRVKDFCFATKHIEEYKHGKIQAINDTTTAKLPSCYQEILSSFGVKANLIVPIIASEQLWGLLVAHQCNSPRQWEVAEITILKQLAIQLGIAVQQAELYQQVQSFNTYLELKVKQRTAILQNAVRFETLIRKVTEKVRDSLDEPQILHTVTQEIGEVLSIDRCKIELYNYNHTTATIAYEYTVNSPTCQNTTRRVADFGELYQQLLKKQSLQFVEQVPELSPLNIQATRLVCPIFDNQGVLGNLWLLRPRDEYFEISEISLVEQVANQCAIAIRQARLYQQSQTQINELAKLNVIKDDFLRTISHELRTPMSSIILASETLETLLEHEIGTKKSTTFIKVLDIFRAACKRQNQLVDDLLTLCYTDVKKETLTMQWIEFGVWLPQIIEPFIERINQQKQELVINLDANFPLFKSDISTIKRILVELLNNACKYTPIGETIAITADTSHQGIIFIVSNTGVEIPPAEQKLVFDKFYRIPSQDPWQFGGTGIGLALVKSLVELLNGTIELESCEQRTTFIISFTCEISENL
ncbi:GAF sensor signal transduction histidine kinase [Chondrocystis sp. NIES-4102]|nr:GAF sensor signal transduction histidine kinase [Chondrocystis sp. NIES-4102]